MEFETFNRLEKEIDNLLNVLIELKGENKQIKEKYLELIEKQNENKKLIESLKKENLNLSSVENNVNSEKEAKIKKGLQKLLIKLDKLPLI